ncbi:hypothetical protein HMN09_00213100 [Mycena chlorophos]|uniref:FAD-binding domain-containing protein n=1 Tax=Mycena chlorophos TaxID=658473 RepID=A0A8H6TP94_MYCCL|nr:hypothetical protein HMN09_00213100 [Mycena chlorophos]
MPRELNFIVVGASVAGLAAAIGLKKAGHEVLVLEKAERLGEGHSMIPVGCARVPPNGSKILYDWGLGEEVNALDYPTEVKGFFAGYRYEGTGPDHARDLLGYQSYSEEMLSEARGNYLIMRQEDIAKILSDELHRTSSESAFDTPQRPSVNKSEQLIRFNANVVSIDLDACAVTLANGEVLRADVIIGADGPNGVVRSALLKEEEDAGVSWDDDGSEFMEVDPQAPALGAMNPPRWFYNGIISQEDAAKVDSEEMKSYLERGMSIFFGSNCTAVVLRTGHGLSFYVITDIVATNISDSLGADCDSGLRQLAMLADANTASPPIIFQRVEYTPLESWVSESGRVVVIGEAAHPLIPGSLQSYAVSLEDGAFLGKIFTHTDDPERIPEFLHAFQEHRQPRTNMIAEMEKTYIAVLALPNGAAQRVRDAAFRENYARGRDLADMMEGTEAGDTMEETRFLFGYSPQDDADEWWMTWGRFHDSPLAEGPGRNAARQSWFDFANGNMGSLPVAHVAVSTREDGSAMPLEANLKSQWFFTTSSSGESTPRFDAEETESSSL